MSYQVLARKWRPSCFSEVVGQSHIVTALKHALTTNRLHHAYLFTGTRGVGKTTLARILAKALNCEQGIQAEPCNTCSSCQAINQGVCVDLLEIDAASRTRVEDTRELLDNVQYKPTQGRYKVYIIDEVHMLSSHSFNALLKTLEEPPEYVKFLLATTEPDKLPVTVLSRCIRFHLKHLTATQIQTQLQRCITEEQMIAEQEALAAIAEAASGSMRDALSLLDQAIAFGSGQVNTIDVHAMLGTIQSDHITDILTAIAEKSPENLLAKVQEMSLLSTDFTQALAKLSSTLLKLAWLKVIPDASKTNNEPQILVKLAERFSAEDLQLLYQITLHGSRDLPLAADSQQGFEMTLLRMLAFFPGSLKPELSKKQLTTRPEPVESENKTPKVGNLAEEVSDLPEKLEQQEEVLDSSVTDIQKITDWAQAVQAMHLNGITGMLANHCILKEQTPHNIVLALDSSHQAFANPDQKGLLQVAVSRYLGREINLKFDIESMQAVATPAKLQAKANEKQRQAVVETFTQDEQLQNIANTFGAVIDEKQIQIVNKQPIEE